jgi:hypothetical protein
MSLRAVLTREAKTIRFGGDALNALYKLVLYIYANAFKNC